MWRHIKVNLADLLFSVSEAMDLSDPSLVDHQIRTAYIASELARLSSMDHAGQERLFVAALLHDIGALSPEEKLGIHVEEDLRPEPHCLRGARLFREAFWLAPSAPIVEWHHTSMHKHEAAGRSLADTPVLAAQILMLADYLERGIVRGQFILHQVAHLRTRVRRLAGSALHVTVAGLLEQAGQREDFWLAIVSKDLAQHLRQRSLLRSIDLDFAAARAMASVLKDITDFRSRFTASHSSGVALCARGIAERLHFSGKDLQQIELAGYLHDIGKLVVPNAILYKDGPLTEQEYALVRQHPYYTHRILASVRGFEQIAEWAAFHHERLDGSGYPGRLDRHGLDLGAKVVAVADVATAVAEQRPYRAPGDEAAVLGVLRDMAARGLLETAAIEVLAQHYEPIMSAVRLAQANDEKRYRERYASIETG